MPAEDPAALDLTQLLQRMKQGDQEASDTLLRVLYAELHARARIHMNGQGHDHTLQATALVNEAWIRLTRNEEGEWVDRKHFLAVASTAMRHVLVDHARHKGRDKCAAPGARVDLNGIIVAVEERAIDIEVLDVLLDELAAFDPELAQIIQMRFFGGATNAEIAGELGCSERTIERRVKEGRAWLYGQIMDR